MNTKFFHAEFLVSNVPNDTRSRFLFPEELMAYVKRQREALRNKIRYANPMRKALQYQSILTRNPELNKSQLAKKLGKSRVHVTQLLSLLRLPTQIRQKILQTRGISERAIRPLIRIQNQVALQLEFERILKDKCHTYASSNNID